MAQEHMPRVSTPLFQSLLLNLPIRLVGECARREECSNWACTGLMERERSAGSERTGLGLSWHTLRVFECPDPEQAAQALLQLDLQALATLPCLVAAAAAS